MSPKSQNRLAGALICIAMLACAFVSAPRSCEGGLEAYALTGAAGIVGLVAAPLVLRRDLGTSRRGLVGAAFAAVGVAVWIAGLFAANVRIFCRLF